MAAIKVIIALLSAMVAMVVALEPITTSISVLQVDVDGCINIPFDVVEALMHDPETVTTTVTVTHKISPSPDLAMIAHRDLITTIESAFCVCSTATTISTVVTDKSQTSSSTMITIASSPGAVTPTTVGGNSTEIPPGSTSTEAPQSFATTTTTSVTTSVTTSMTMEVTSAPISTATSSVIPTASTTSTSGAFGGIVNSALGLSVAVMLGIAAFLV